jgi:hypothetical protein
MRVRAVIVAIAMASGPALAQGQGVSSIAPLAVPAPAALSDTDLEQAVRAAYVAATGFAAAHGRYFARDGILPPLRDAVSTALSAAGFASVAVPEATVGDLPALKTCLVAPGTELRIASNAQGDGLTLAVVTEAQLFAYAYDPHKAAGVVVTPAENCALPQ